MPNYDCVGRVWIVADVELKISAESKEEAEEKADVEFQELEGRLTERVKADDAVNSIDSSTSDCEDVNESDDDE